MIWYSYFIIHIWGIFLIPFILFGCTEDYKIHRELSEIKNNQTAQSEKIHLRDISWSLFISPDINNIQKYIKYIDNAKERVWIEVYTLTEKSIRTALVNAKKRWIDVKVLLEWNVYNAPNVNKETFKQFKDAWIDVRYASNLLYTFTHSKFAIIDSGFILSTANLSYTSFSKNREFFFLSDDIEILEFLTSVFLTDFEKKEAIFSIPKEIVLSPINSRKQLENIIQNAKKRIIVYTQSLSDPKILKLLKETSKKWVNIAICIANNEDINTEILSLPEQYKNVTLSRPKKPYIHTKTILIDHEYIYLGSINLSRNSIENNREVWLIWNDINQDAFSQVEKRFREDCQ